MTWFWGHLYFTILFCIILIQSLNCSLLSRSRNPSEYVLQPVYLPDDITDDMFNGLIEQRPDLEPFLRAQRKTQLRRQQMSYLMKKKQKKQKSKYPFYERYERNNSDDDEVVLLENDDDDITRPLSDFDDGRTTELIDPTLVPEYTLTQKHLKETYGIDNKEPRFNDSRRWTTEARAWRNAWKAASCYTCHTVRSDHIPRSNACHTAFNSDDFRLARQIKYFRTTCYYNWDYRNAGYWRYKHYMWKGKSYPGYYGMTVHRMGCFTKGCMKRYSDVGEVFTMRACRGYWPMYIGGLLEHRQIRMDYWIGIYPNHTCRFAHHATLIPFSRGISLFGRLRSCSCVGRYCNNTVVNNIYMPLLIIGFLLIIINY